MVATQDQFRLVLNAGLRQPDQQPHERTSSYLSFVEALQAAILRWGSGAGAVLRQVCVAHLTELLLHAAMCNMGICLFTRPEAGVACRVQGPGLAATTAMALL